MTFKIERDSVLSNFLPLGSQPSKVEAICYGGRESFTIVSPRNSYTLHLVICDFNIGFSLTCLSIISSFIQFKTI